MNTLKTQDSSLMGKTNMTKMMFGYLEELLHDTKSPCIHFPYAFSKKALRPPRHKQ